MKPKGRHPYQKLNAINARRLSAPGRYADGNGLYLVVAPSGAKAWILRTVVQRRRRDIGLGSFATVSLADARKTASEFRETARSGGNPLATRHAAKSIPTFEQAARRVHGERDATWKNAKHRAQWLTSLETYIFPAMGSLPVDKIESPEVRNALIPFWLSKPETARRVMQRIGTVLDWAAASGFRQGANPTLGLGKGLPKQTQAPRHHAALPYEDVPTFIRELRQSDAGAAVKLAFEFLILTATRTNETIKAKWDEINEDTWTIPADRMKNKQAFRVPLTTRCQEILQEAKQFSDGEFIFPGRARGTSLSNMALLETIKRLKREITAHGFRSSFKDWATECTSFPFEVSEAALSHAVKDKTVAAYQRGDIFEKRRDLMMAWQKHAIPPLKKGKNATKKSGTG